MSKKKQKIQKNIQDLKRGLNIQKTTLLNNNEVELKLKKKRKLNNIIEKAEYKSKKHCSFDKDFKNVDENGSLLDKDYKEDFQINHTSNINKLLLDNDSNILDNTDTNSLNGFESDDFNNKKSFPQDDIFLQNKMTQKKDTQNVQELSKVIYLGRIPHGFYELEMKNYFEQFGTVTRIKLSRNRRTGKSKHYAFIEFESSEVAKIAAKAMNNYLLFGHILKCSVISKEKLHKSMFIGANKRFKPIPWSRITMKRLEEAKTKEQWIRLQKRNNKRLKKKKELLKKLGIDYQYDKNK
ncbi:hypothetical protein T552_03300 [Pneumocystis carinii B80]|uniref:RRM domain-containing protein n=1 Tax=Pneumocystis carinii (strain B80) TaxID=1408658 RepID=A0A0W4ZC96_PNEC8|nr:hypothetical protein T552_03300 [Pneumocystis carinii B80]KTW26031.1 hypothetical protein T552_03300 [Pneumocystis carinii B80]